MKIFAQVSFEVFFKENEFPALGMWGYSPTRKINKI